MARKGDLKGQMWSRAHSAAYAFERYSDRSILWRAEPLVLIPRATPFVTQVGVGRTRKCMFCEGAWVPVYEFFWQYGGPREINARTSEFEVWCVILEASEEADKGSLLAKVEVAKEAYEFRLPLSTNPNRILLQGRFRVCVFELESAQDPTCSDSPGRQTPLAVWKPLKTGEQGAFGVAVYGEPEKPDPIKSSTQLQRVCTKCLWGEAEEKGQKIGRVFLLDHLLPQVAPDSFGAQSIELTERPFNLFDVGVLLVGKPNHQGKVPFVMHYAHSGVFREPPSIATIFVPKGGQVLIQDGNLGAWIENQGNPWKAFNLLLKR